MSRRYLTIRVIAQNAENAIYCMLLIFKGFSGRLPP
jgi:hypothetical protein